jgi:hypothetical protein
MPTLHSILDGKPWVQQSKADVPARIVLVAWYSSIHEDINGSFPLREFSTHWQRSG